MDYLTTASGKQFECGYFIQINNPDRLYIRISNSPIGEVATVFYDPNETEKLLFGELVVYGFTRLLSLVPEDGIIRVTLTKE